MKKLLSILKSVLFELLIVLVYILLINNYIGNVDNNIGESDGQGYYDYLPSGLIHNDLDRKDISIQDTAFYSRIDGLPGYIDYQDSKLNKYPCGTAIMQLPFFSIAYATTELEGTDQDGYQTSFQKSIFFAALFYLFLALFFLKKTLELHQVKRFIIVFIQLLLVLGTTVTHYANADASYSHVYSLFAICAFIYFVTRYFKQLNLKHFLFACVFLGLIVLLRQINILIVLSIPFLAGSWLNLKAGIQKVVRNYKWLIAGIVTVLAIASIQCIFWHLQTGHWILYSYQEEGFDFSSPEIFNTLFSYHRGLFIYTPILFISLSGVVWMALKKHYYQALTWFLFFTILIYIFSSWWTWHYGDGYGLRVYIEFYPLFFIPFAFFLNEISLKLKLAIAAFAVLTIPLNIIQTYQYKSYILHWEHMDKDSYWSVFLKTEPRYEGFLWKKEFHAGYYNVIKELDLGTIKCPENSTKIIHVIKGSDIPLFDQVHSIQVILDNGFSDEDETILTLQVRDGQDASKNLMQARHLIQFNDKGLNNWHTGSYHFNSEELEIQKDNSIFLKIKAPNVDCVLNHVKVKFLILKK